ncbi:hypothetical protein [Hyalangium versicolor]|uniref:hypothetical protein n=1 Tax=Hyalangium versicolor TaxID=2861190 RepID=UPI001CCBEE08|nr:hypothetical protein [Hyalangium versicolor]
MQRGWRVAVFTAALGVGGTAYAHEFDCEKRVNGQPVVHVEEYPITVRFDDRLINIHPTAPSLALNAEDTGLTGRGWSFEYALPLAVPVGESADQKFLIQLGSYEECRALAAQDGSDDGAFDSTFRVVWPLGEDQCAARLVCDPPYVPPPPTDCEVTNSCPEPRVTRDEGFFKVHEQALQQCVELFPIELGSLGTVSTLEQALGVLWGSPSLYRNGESRTPLDTARLLLARQVLVAHCNAYLFGSFTRPADLLDTGRTALSGAQCQGIGALRSALREMNVEGRELVLPADVDPGPPTPAHAQSIADDFTQPSGQNCLPGGQ